MSTEIPLLGFLAEIKTHKGACAHTQTLLHRAAWGFRRGQTNREEESQKVGE